MCVFVYNVWFIFEFFWKAFGVFVVTPWNLFSEFVLGRPFQQCTGHRGQCGGRSAASAESVVE